MQSAPSLCSHRHTPVWLSLLALSGLLTVSARADVEITRRWCPRPPVIDGTVSPGEWNIATATALHHGQLRTMNDGNYLYVLLDVTGDTVNDPVPTPGADGDYFDLEFDKDLNHAVTPNVDFDYSTCQDGRTFVKSIRLSAYSWTGCRPVDVNTLGADGFGPTFNSGTPHRFWEMRLAFAELGVDPSTWTTSAGAVPKVRLNVRIHSKTPSFDVSLPDPSSSPNNVNLYQLDLATSPSFPPGSTGPTFAGVGLVPASYIDGNGYANISIADYYYATNAPFGANLNVFGNWNTLRLAYGATRYRVLYSRDGGPFTRLKQTWTNFKFNGTTWVPSAIGPDANDAYPVPVPWEIWYLPNLLVSWQTTVGFPDGTYRLKLELLNAGGSVLGSPPGNSLTLFVDNTPPSVVINDATYQDGATSSSICECGIVNQGECQEFQFPKFIFRGLKFDLTVTDPHGALNTYALSYYYGNNLSGSITSDSYTAHANQDGPNQWNGVSNSIEPGLRPFCAPKSCAYTFALSASSRVQNGYGLVFPYVDYKKSLTILLGNGAGSVNCP